MSIDEPHFLELDMQFTDRATMPENNVALKLWRAAFHGNTHDMKKLLAVEKVDVSLPVGRNGETALHVAAFYGHAGVARALLKFGASVSSRDGCGITPLLEACAFCPLAFSPFPSYTTYVTNRRIRVHAQRSVITLLLENGAVLTETDDAGNTVLHVTACNGCPELMRFLLHARPANAPIADVSAMNRGGATPLHWVVGMLDLHTKYNVVQRELQEHLALVLVEGGAKLSTLGVYVEHANVLYGFGGCGGGGGHDHDDVGEMKMVGFVHECDSRMYCARKAVRPPPDASALLAQCTPIPASKTPQFKQRLTR